MIVYYSLFDLILHLYLSSLTPYMLPYCLTWLVPPPHPSYIRGIFWKDRPSRQGISLPTPIKNIPGKIYFNLILLYTDRTAQKQSVSFKK